MSCQLYRVIPGQIKLHQKQTHFKTLQDNPLKWSKNDRDDSDDSDDDDDDDDSDYKVCYRGIHTLT